MSNGRTIPRTQERHTLTETQDTAETGGAYRILLLEESELLCWLFERWLSPVPVTSVQSLDELHTHLGSTVTVACLCQSVLGDDATQVRKDILNSNPYCQLVLIQSRGGFLTLHEDEYDAVLRRPLSRAALRTTVEHRLKCGVYSAYLRKFYALNAALIWSERDDTPTGEQMGDRNEADTTEQLVEQHRNVQAKLQQLQEHLTSEDVNAITRSIHLHNRFLTAPVNEKPDTGASKYHPPRCPDCKLPWGVDHGNALGIGFERVAAHVWKCTQCNEIVQGLGASHRRVTNR